MMTEIYMKNKLPFVKCREDGIPRRREVHTSILIATLTHRNYGKRQEGQQEHTDLDVDLKIGDIMRR